jgi:hypothetical protein
MGAIVAFVRGSDQRPGAAFSRGPVSAAAQAAAIEPGGQIEQATR